MKTTLITCLAASLYGSLVSASPFPLTSLSQSVEPRASCENTATSRNCWGNYSIDTDFYTVIPSTGVTREYWLNVENTTLAPDGVERQVLCFNGTIPGPTIIADWGDDIVIHVTNNMQDNGTAIHWHGIRQLNSVEYDGVPGVTQCPIAPGDTLTYKFHADQYGSTWYHSHFTLQYAEGLLGPMIINGPATANYDEDLGALFLSDWSHKTIFSLWDSAKLGAPPTLENGLINGTNTYEGGGSKFEVTFVSGTKYRLRIINTAIDGHFQFSIDGHTFQVIATDLVPIVPYTTDSILVSIGQRYDIVVEASADVSDYWLRGGWVTGCSSNSNAANITGIVRYDSTSTADPTTTSNVTVSTSCGDEPLESLVPHFAMNVGNYSGAIVEDLSFGFPDYFRWTINSSSLVLDWSNPTDLQIHNNISIFPTVYNVIPVDISGENDWVVFIIEDKTGFGATHPIHLHGHDFFVISQTTAVYDPATTVFNMSNPPRRDVASLPGNGHLAIAFRLDNPGSWLTHCHIAWHASEGLALEFVESESSISASLTDTDTFLQTCTNWDAFTQIYAESDSGI